MAPPFQTHLNAAMAPLLARTARRVERVKRLATQPLTDATRTAMEAEQREIELVHGLTTDLARILTLMQRVITHNTAKCHELGAALALAQQQATTWEQRFYQSLEALPELPDEKAPPLILSGYAALVRRQHLLRDPATYAATYPSPYRVPFTAFLPMFEIPGLSVSPALDKPPRDFAAGIYRVSRVREAMLHGYREGKPRGTTTYFPAFDAHWTHKSGEITLTTGYANHGKSEMMDELELIKSVCEPGKAWGVFSPENAPADELYDNLVHKLTGYSPDPDWCQQYNRLQVSPAAYERAMDWLENHFIIINPKDEKPTLECLLDHFDYLHGQTPLYGVRLDPWNQVFHEMKGQRDDQYLSEKLSDLARWTMQEDRPMCTHLVAHPRSPAKLKDGELPVPDQFDLNSGAMFGNKVWNVLTCHRPQYHVSKSDTSVQWWSHKIKKQKRVGRPGFIDLGYDYLSNRYMLSGTSPMAAAAAWLFKGIPLTEAGNAIQSARVQANEFPASAFNDGPAPF